MDRTTQFLELAEILEKTVPERVSLPPRTEDKSLSNFYIASYRIVNNIHKLDYYLKDNTQKYITFKPLFSFSKGMSDKERNQIHMEAKNCIEEFHKQMALLGKLFKLISDPNQQQIDHCKSIFKYIENYLLMVENSYKQLRKLQIKYFQQPYQNNYLTKIPEGNPKKIHYKPYSESNYKEDIPQLDEKQSKMLVEENKHLQERLFVYHEKLGEISQQVHDIQYLTDQMAGYVEVQSETLNYIEKQTGEANSNVRRGNENLIQLKANSKDMRLFLLTLLVFLSFALLFLHWLNP